MGRQVDRTPGALGRWGKETDRFGRRRGAPPRNILAVSSGGGHWSELLRIAPALSGHCVTWVTTGEEYEGTAPPGAFLAVRDASRWNKMGLAVLLAQIARIVARVRPEIVITTGAAPGYLAIRLGKLAGAATIWIDSIANASELSLSGRRALRHADLCLTQWEHLSAPGGPSFLGSVL